MTINGVTLAGVKPGNKFKESLYAPLEMKEYISNESRLEHGKRVLTVTSSGVTSLIPGPKYKSRSLSLEFQITASTPSALETRLSALFTELYKGLVTLRPTEYSNDVFHLIYTGKSPTYDCGKCACKVKIGFDEPNPGNRT